MLILTYTLVILLMIFVPVALAAWLRRVAPVAWLLFAIGCLTFIVSQIVHLPLNDQLANLGLLPEQGLGDFPLWQVALTLGLTAGLSEELARAAGYVLIRRWKPAWLRLQDAVMLGLGHGGFEAMIIGVVTAATVSSLLPLVGANLDALGLPPEQLAVLRMQLDQLTGNLWLAGLPLLERLMAMGAHVVFSIMVWKAFAPGGRRVSYIYILLAILYHAAVDYVAVWGAYTFQNRLWLAELSLLAVLLPGYAWALWQVRKRPPAARQGAAPGPYAAQLTRELPGEWQVFWIATRKELVQLWRTRRVLIVGAVFLIFGMLSPLIAKLTPAMLSSLEGAEMFADLIPEPTAGDGVVQYVKNLSQFGFIIAVVLGMSAVANEKERGIAPLILSKPMPRWAFIASKFAAQFGMYLVAFALSGLGAYYYSVILFGSLDPGGFLLLNGLLLLWLLTFVALSLLGSTVGATTAAAGGIGLALSVILMLAGSIPRYGALLPGGLLGWASAVGQAAAGVPASMPGASGVGAAVIANGGAAASALVVIVLALILSLGVFEQQEL